VIWMLNPFAALLSASTARTAKLVLQGVARETSLRCPLKIKEMIMPGILSEGSG
jgi:hypothetical protein